MRYLILHFLLVAGLSVLAQKQGTRNTDSLLTAYELLPDDTEKVNRWNGIASYFNRKGVYDAANKISQKARSLALKLSHEKGILEANNNLGIYFMYNGNYPKALECYYESVRILNRSGNKHMEAVVLNNMGGVYYSINDTARAMEKYRESFRIASGTGDKEVMAMATLGMGNIYYMYQRSVPSLQNYRQSLQYATEGKFYSRVADALVNIGNVYGSMRSFDSSYVYFTKTLAMREKIQDLRGVAHCQENLGILCLDMGRMQESEKWLLTSIENAKRIGALDLVEIAEDDMTELYEATGRYDLAFEHYKRKIRARDSLFNEENTRNMVKTEMNYEFEKKEASTKAEQDKKDAIAIAEKKKQSIILLSISGFGLLVLGFAVFAYRSFLQKKKANIEISAQKHIIEEKQKEILDSIYYARRIQRSLITSERYIAKKLDLLMNK